MTKILIVLLLTFSVGLNLYIFGRDYLRRQQQRYYDLAVFQMIEKAKSGGLTLMAPDEAGNMKKYELILKQ